MSAKIGLSARTWLAKEMEQESCRNLDFAFLAHSLLDVHLFAIGASRADGEYPR